MSAGARTRRSGRVDTMASDTVRHGVRPHHTGGAVPERAPPCVAGANHEGTG